VAADSDKARRTLLPDWTCQPKNCREQGRHS
jgi:hypothetical protein